MPTAIAEGLILSVYAVVAFGAYTEKTIIWIYTDLLHFLRNAIRWNNDDVINRMDKTAKSICCAEYHIILETVRNFIFKTVALSVIRIILEALTITAICSLCGFHSRNITAFEARPVVIGEQGTFDTKGIIGTFAVYCPLTSFAVQGPDWIYSTLCIQPAFELRTRMKLLVAHDIVVAPKNGCIITAVGLQPFCSASRVASRTEAVRHF